MQVLSTKVSSPPLRARLVNRKRLLEKLNQGLDCGFVLISAPAGYGKSTLVRAWLNQSALPFAWFALDEGDNDPSRFLTYLAAALHQMGVSFEADFDGAVQALQPPQSETYLTQLVNQFAQTSPFWLVLDDYHVIQNQGVHQVINFLLEHRPSPCHLVLITRADPPLPLARLRVRAQMVELRLADLRFRLAEATDFLNHTMGLKLTSEEVEHLMARTEGWIAGLQMAALALQTIGSQGLDAQDKLPVQNAEEISNFITTLTGSHHYIFDYLLEEVLARQAPEIRRFLLFTSILDQLTPSLCDALLVDDASTPLNSSVFLLETLERLNLFILPVDATRQWYRYHALFADLLRSYLQRTHPESIPALHLRASVWFEEQDLIPDAIHHALAVGDWARVVRLISANVFALLEQRELNTVIRRLDVLTGNKHYSEPWLWIGRSWLAAYTGQLGTLETLLSNAETGLEKLENTDYRQTLRGHCAAIRAFSAWVSGEGERAGQSAREALDCLPISDQTIRCQSATILGLSCTDLDVREQAHALALEYARGIRVSHVVIFAYGCQAYLFLLKGKLHKAFDICKQAIQIAHSSPTLQPFPSLSHVYATLSEVYREWNDLAHAVYYAREAVSLARRWEQVDALHYAYTNLGEALFATGDIEDAFKTLEQEWEVARRTSKWFEQITLAQEVKWHLTLGNLEAAHQRLRHAQVDISQPVPVLSPLLSGTIAEVYLAEKQYTQALETIVFLIGKLEKRKNVYFKVRLLVGQALGHFHLGQRIQALESLKQAVQIAAPEDYVRSFLSSDEALSVLLHQTLLAGVAPEYVGKLVALNEIANPDNSPSSPEPRLVEPLSGREMDVLRLLAQGDADKKIAATLIIARETVHKHLKNIYEKLGVHSRTEAIARARDLGVL